MKRMDTNAKLKTYGGKFKKHKGKQWRSKFSISDNASKQFETLLNPKERRPILFDERQTVTTHHETEVASDLSLDSLDSPKFSVDTVFDKLIKAPSLQPIRYTTHYEKCQLSSSCNSSSDAEHDSKFLLRRSTLKNVYDTPLSNRKKSLETKKKHEAGRKMLRKKVLKSRNPKKRQLHRETFKQTGPSISKALSPSLFPDHGMITSTPVPLKPWSVEFDDASPIPSKISRDILVTKLSTLDLENTVLRPYGTTTCGNLLVSQPSTSDLDNMSPLPTSCNNLVDTPSISELDNIGLPSISTSSNHLIPKLSTAELSNISPNPVKHSIVDLFSQPSSPELDNMSSTSCNVIDISSSLELDNMSPHPIKNSIIHLVYQPSTPEFDSKSPLPTSSNHLISKSTSELDNTSPLPTSCNGLVDLPSILELDSMSSLPINNSSIHLVCHPSTPERDNISPLPTASSHLGSKSSSSEFGNMSPLPASMNHLSPKASIPKLDHVSPIPMKSCLADIPSNAVPDVCLDVQDVCFQDLDIIAVNGDRSPQNGTTVQVETPHYQELSACNQLPDAPDNTFTSLSPCHTMMEVRSSAHTQNMLPLSTSSARSVSVTPGENSSYWTMEIPCKRRHRSYYPMVIGRPMSEAFFQVEVCKAKPSSRELVLAKCGQSEPMPFTEAFPSSYTDRCVKIGEGVYGEVYLQKTEDGSPGSVLKIIPIEGPEHVNGEPQKKFGEVLSEVVIAMELSSLRQGQESATYGFNEVLRCLCVQGQYPPRLLQLWQEFAQAKGSDNDSPEIFHSEQLFIILELAYGGISLEAYEFSSAKQSLAIFQQAVCALAVAEMGLQFEHRDLHWGNLLVTRTPDKFWACTLAGETLRVPTEGMQVAVIDFTLSRLSADSCILFNNLSKDPDLFMGQGDPQFQVYRDMKAALGDDWSGFEPRTNALWLQYLASKMLSGLHYKRTATHVHKRSLAALRKLHTLAGDANSAVALVTAMGL